MAEAPHQQRHMPTKMLEHLRENGRGPRTEVCPHWRDENANRAQFAAFSDPGRRNRTPHDPSWELDTGRLQQLVVNSEVGDGDQ